MHVNRVAMIAGAAIIWGVGGRSEAQWQVISLHPNGADGSWAYAVRGGRQVGHMMLANGFRHAMLWNGSATEWVDLHPGGTALESFARGIAGNQQAGTVRGLDYYGQPYEHAGVWSGTPESWLDLNPPLSPPRDSVAYCTDGAQQGGYVQVEWDHASVWSGTAESWVDLHPPEASRSAVFGVSDGRQIGYATTDRIRASLWSGTAGSWVDLNPPWAIRSWGYAISGAEQVGTVTVTLGGVWDVIHACLWLGTAESAIDLHPAAVPLDAESYAFGVSSGWQVGAITQTVAMPRASLWHGTAESWVDLHALLPPQYCRAEAWGVDVFRNRLWIVGWAFNLDTGRDEAILWLRKISVAGDLDEDGDVDLADFAGFQACFNGPNRSPKKLGCENADFEPDGDVDLADFALFQACFNGPNRPPKATCL